MLLPASVVQHGRVPLICLLSLKFLPSPPAFPVQDISNTYQDSPSPQMLYMSSFKCTHVPCKYFMTSYESGHQLQKSAVPIPCTQGISDRKAGQNLQDLRPAAIVQPSCFRLPKVCFPKCSIYNGCGDTGSAAANDRLLRINTLR